MSDFDRVIQRKVPQVVNVCNHCSTEFNYAYLCSLCPKCFLTGHRFSDCGEHCKATPITNAAVTEMLTQLGKRNGI